MVFLSVMGHIFLFLCIHANFYWLPDIVNFILLGARYFCILINILELCSGVQKLFGNSSVLSGLAFVR